MKKFKPYDCVLVKIDSSENFWSADFYDRFDSKTSLHRTISGKSVTDENILSFNSETEYLHNTTEDYVEWEPKKGDVILVRDNDDEDWMISVFDYKDNNRYVCIAFGATHNDCDEIDFVYWNFAKPYVNPFKSIDNF